MVRSCSAVLSGLLLAGCGGPAKTEVSLKDPGPATVPPGYVHHSAPDNAFSLSLPPGWEVVPVTEKLDTRSGVRDAGAAVVGGMERSSLVAKKKEGIAALSPVGPGSARAVVAAMRMTLYDSGKYDQFRKESFDVLKTHLKGGSAPAKESKLELPVGPADVLEATWTANAETFVLKSYFLRDKSDTVYQIDVLTAAGQSGQLPDLDAAVQSFRPGRA